MPLLSPKLSVTYMLSVTSVQDMAAVITIAKIYRGKYNKVLLMEEGHVNFYIRFITWDTEFEGIMKNLKITCNRSE